MTEESRRFLIFTLVFVAIIAGDITAVATGGRTGVIVGITVNVGVVVAILVAALFIRHRPLPHASPDSRIARFEHWMNDDSLPPARYCSHCGRPRMRVTTFDYLPPSPAEQRARCTPMSCEWFDAPSVAEPPSATSDASEQRQYRDLLWRPDAE